MAASPYGALHAAAESAPCSSRAYLDAAGEAHWRAVMGMAHDRVPITDDATAAAVVDVIAAEVDRMATIYREAGCSRRQVRAFARAFHRGAAVQNAEALALSAAKHHESA